MVKFLRPNQPYFVKVPARILDLMTEEPVRDVVVFDLDGTLVRDDSFSRFLLRLLMRSRRRGLGAAVTFPLVGSIFAVPHRATRTAAVNLWLWIGTAGLSDAAYEELAREFAEEHACETSGRQIGRAVAKLREHVAQGHRVLVVTGSEERLAGEICRVMGLADVEIVGSTLRRRWGALAAGVHCYGPAKLHRLEAAGARPPFACAYTDSAADLPLLLAAAERYLVEPKPRQLRRILDRAAGCLPLPS